ncbi:MAG: hypothetical protein ABWJ97_02800 [Thermoproteus sp.]
MGLPREKSVFGILTFSLILALAGAAPKIAPLGAALAVVAYVLHIATFDPIFDTILRPKPKTWALVAANLAPYAASIVLGLWSPPAFALAALIFASYMALAARRLARSVEGVVLGTAMLSSIFLLAKSMADPSLTLYDYAVYALFVGYHVATAYYVESRLAFREVSPWTPLAAWIPAVALAAAARPLLLVAAIEPTAKFAYNIAKNVKYRTARDISKMGWREMARSALLTVILAALYHI